MQAWWSPWRNRVVGVVAGLILLFLFLGRGGGSGNTGSSADASKESTTVVEQTAVLQAAVFENLDPKVALQSGELQRLVLAKDTEVWAKKVAEKLGVKVELKKDGDSWSGGGLTVREDGNYTYENPSVKNAGCSVNEECEGETPQSAKAVQEVMATSAKRAVEVAQAGLPDVNVQARAVVSNRTRISVRLMMQRGPVHLSESAQVTFLLDGTIANATGILGKWEFGEMTKFEDSLSAFSRISADGRMVRTGFGGGPRSGSRVRIASVHLTAVPKGRELLMGWAYETMEGDVWVVEAKEGSGKRNPAITAPQAKTETVITGPSSESTAGGGG